jgi:deoxyribonuclease-4
MDAAHFGDLAGATDIVFHPGTYFGQPSNEVLPIAIPRLQGCLDELRAAGNPVRLRPETMGKSALLGSLDDTLEMGHSLPGIEPCVDFAHLHARPGDGSLNTYAEFAGVLEAISTRLGQTALQRLHIHLSGIAYGPKGEKEHLELKDSDLNVREIMQALVNYNCRGRILCESPVMEEDALGLKSLWREVSGES